MGGCRYHWIRRKGRAAAREVAPIVVSNHVSFLDPIFFFYELFPSIVSSQSHERFPIVGTIIRSMQVQKKIPNPFSWSSQKFAHTWIFIHISLCPPPKPWTLKPKPSLSYLSPFVCVFLGILRTIETDEAFLAWPVLRRTLETHWSFSCLSCLKNHGDGINFSCLIVS